MGQLERGTDMSYGDETEAIEWWKGEEGNLYTARNNPDEAQLRARRDLFDEILDWTRSNGLITSVCEIGCNRGANLRVLQRMGYNNLFGVEPNESARKKAIELCEVYESIHQIGVEPDLVFTCGVLIHVPPTELKETCLEIVELARTWVLAIEYFSAEPRMIEYRGTKDRLWSRDFGSFYLDNFPCLEPVACGFAWKPMTGLDNLTWTLLRKT